MHVITCILIFIIDNDLLKKSKAIKYIILFNASLENTLHMAGVKRLKPLLEKYLFEKYQVI